MSRVLPIYDGAIRAHETAAFVMGGETFHIISPGYCIQGKRRLTWTQVVHDDIPVFEAKVRTDVKSVVAHFETLWRKHIGDDPVLLRKALEACKAERRRKFRDGKTAVTPAPSITRDGRGEGRRYPA